jgi:hypothetical protein
MKQKFIILSEMQQMEVNFGHVRNIHYYEHFQLESQHLPFSRMEIGKSEEG